MPSNLSPPRQRPGYQWFFYLIALAGILLPLIWDKRIMMSPVLLFGAACVSTVANHLIQGTGRIDEDGLYSRVFYLRLIVSIAAVFLLLAIDHIARSFAD
ncbi:hypothetical protein [Massilia sp. H6]|uniref:hypothetical protein n=1 Tax=Massilia sp. H6 TaxID=2970464 RepID=UPI0021679A4C|nr:hypothetical protein [Massilia sp. H6]UVW29019.1 hypothetical protein NRS07_02430 [Massilia sp. H6]